MEGKNTAANQRKFIWDDDIFFPLIPTRRWLLTDLHFLRVEKIDEKVKTLFLRWT